MTIIVIFLMLGLIFDKSGKEKVARQMYRCGGWAFCIGLSFSALVFVFTGLVL